MPAVVMAIFALVSRLLMAKAVMWVIHIMAFLGLAFATNEYLVQPIIDMITGRTGGLPADITAWAGAFGIDKVLSILTSAYTIRGAKKVFLGARS